MWHPDVTDEQHERPSIPRQTNTEEDSVHHRLARLAAYTLLGVAYISVPVAPLLAAAVFGRKKYVLHYRSTLLKTVRHIRAMQRGPALHFFRDVAGQVQQVPEHIEGECVQLRLLSPAPLRHRALQLPQLLCGASAATSSDPYSPRWHLKQKSRSMSGLIAVWA
jgi:hypothetical protein